MWLATYRWGGGGARRYWRQTGAEQILNARKQRAGIIAAGGSPAHATKVKNAAISYSEGAIFSYRTGTLPDFIEALLQLAHPPA